MIKMTRSKEILLDQPSPMDLDPSSVTKKHKSIQEVRGTHKERKKIRSFASLIVFRSFASAASRRSILRRVLGSG